jgi:hypothetical protein
MPDGNSPKTIDERLHALTMNLELLSLASEAREKAFASEITRILQAIDKLVTVTNEDANNIRALARIAESHESRINGLESDRT